MPLYTADVAEHRIVNARYFLEAASIDEARDKALIGDTVHEVVAIHGAELTEREPGEPRLHDGPRFLVTIIGSKPGRFCVIDTGNDCAVVKVIDARDAADALAGALNASPDALGSIAPIAATARASGHLLLDQRALDTILAALRYWQAHMDAGFDLTPYIDIAQNDRHGPGAMLAADEIDALIENRINVDQPDETALADAFGGIWGEHPQFPVEDWNYEVGNGDTRLGYWAWTLNQIACAEQNP